MKDVLLVANIIAAVDQIMQDVTGGSDMSDEVKKNGTVSGFDEATAVSIKNKITMDGVN